MQADVTKPLFCKQAINDTYRASATRWSFKSLLIGTSKGIATESVDDLQFAEQNLFVMCVRGCCYQLGARQT